MRGKGTKNIACATFSFAQSVAFPTFKGRKCDNGSAECKCNLINVSLVYPPLRGQWSYIQSRGAAGFCNTYQGSAYKGINIHWGLRFRYNIVLLPGFQRGRDTKDSKGKGRGGVLAEKGNLRRTRKNLKNGHNFTPFRVNKMFSLTF
jgi:hypothetical protein